MSIESDAKFDQQAKDTSLIAVEFASKILHNRQQVTKHIAKPSDKMNTAKSNFAKDEEVFQKRQGEHLEHLLHEVEIEKSVKKCNFDQLKLSIGNVKNKIPVSPELFAA
jgi:hypothetical protein